MLMYGDQETSTTGLSLGLDHVIDVIGCDILTTDGSPSV